MPKRPLKLSIRIPVYAAPRNTWRKAIHRALAERQRTSPVRYEASDRLEVALRLYFVGARSTEIHDVDNRLKDCLDALQGRTEGPPTGFSVMKAAETLGLTIPQSLFVRTDQIIQ